MLSFRVCLLSQTKQVSVAGSKLKQIFWLTGTVPLFIREPMKQFLRALSSTVKDPILGDSPPTSNPKVAHPPSSVALFLKVLSAQLYTDNRWGAFCYPALYPDW